MGQHAKHRDLVKRGFHILALWLLMTNAAQAGCRLALALALDVSSSVDNNEYNLQRLGLAAALDAPEVRHAILNGARGDVALAVYEWSGFYQHKLHLDWVILRTHEDISQAALAIGAMTRSHSDFPTSIGPALGYGATLLERAPRCDRQVIDVSGDGISNYGFSPAAAYREFLFDGVTVNGLVIQSSSAGVAEYYRRNVLHGPNAFLVVAGGFAEFREAMTRKLYREVNDIVLGRSENTLPSPNG
jgi:hypothetical protein